MIQQPWHFVASFLGALWISWGGCVWAADAVTVTATVDRNQMRPGDTFTYSISISSEGSASFEKPTLPDLTAFEVMSEWSGSEMRGTFVNGQVRTQRSQNFNYMLAAKSAGTYTLGAAEVIVNGQVLRTNPISITVTESAPQAPSQAQRRGAPGAGSAAEEDFGDEEDDIFTQLLRRRLGMRPGPGGGGRPGLQGLGDVNPKDAFFIHVEVDKTKAYVGEPITVSWYLVTRAQIADIDTLKYPSLSGFWKEDIEVATRLNFRPEVINGVAYQKALLASYALFPIKPGPAVVDAYQAKCRVVGLSSFGMPQDSQVTKESEAKTIEVLPLPETNKPAHFIGGVGDFTIAARVDTARVKANTPVTLKVRVEGKGNAKFVDLPPPQLELKAQVYDTKSETKYFPNGRSYKEFEILIVPREAGILKIPGYRVAFFNAEKKTYYDQLSPELTVTVEVPDPGSVIPSEELNAPKTSEPTKPQLPPLLLSADEAAPMSLAQQLSVWGLVYLVTAGGLGFFAYRRLGRREKRENLREQIRRRLASVRARADKEDWRGVGVEGTNLVYAVLGEIAGLGGAAFEFNKLVEKAPPSFRRNLAPQLQGLMSRLEILGFAPESVVGAMREKAAIKKLTAEIEKLLLEAAQYDFSSFENEKGATS